MLLWQQNPSFSQNTKNLNSILAALMKNDLEKFFQFAPVKAEFYEYRL